MAPPSGSFNKKSTIYELCKKRIELKSKLQKSQSQTNSNDFEFRTAMLQKSISPNEKSDMLKVCKQYIECQQKEMYDIEKDLQSCSNSIKSELHSENINSFLGNIHSEDQIFPEEETYFKFKKGTQTNSWLKYQKFKMNILLCSICYAQFENKTELVLHIKETHVKKRGRPAIPVECSVCEMKFTCKKDYAIHFRTHSHKTYTCPSCKKMCFFNVSHTCKNKKYIKPKHSVWEACKKVLTEKSCHRVSSANSKFVLKLPISKKVVFFNTPLNKVEFKNIKPKISSNKIVTNLAPLKKKEIINPSYLHSIGCDQDNADHMFGELKNLDDLQSDLMYFETESKNLGKMDDTKFFCNICSISFEDIEKYEAHYSIHLDEEFCEIREGDEKLHVCYVCGGCFTEINAFQVHKLTHVDEEWSDIKN